MDSIHGFCHSEVFARIMLGSEPSLFQLPLQVGRVQPGLRSWCPKYYRVLTSSPNVIMIHSDHVSRFGEYFKRQHSPRTYIEFKIPEGQEDIGFPVFNWHLQSLPINHLRRALIEAACPIYFFLNGLKEPFGDRGLAEQLTAKLSDVYDKSEQRFKNDVASGDDNLAEMDGDFVDYKKIKTDVAVQIPLRRNKGKSLIPLCSLPNSNPSDEDSFPLYKRVAGVFNVRVHTLFGHFGNVCRVGRGSVNIKIEDPIKLTDGGSGVDGVSDLKKEFLVKLADLLGLEDAGDDSGNNGKKPMEGWMRLVALKQLHVYPTSGAHLFRCVERNHATCAPNAKILKSSSYNKMKTSAFKSLRQVTETYMNEFKTKDSYRIELGSVEPDTSVVRKALK